MYNPRISIIVTVYKAERYLRKCLDSIKAQTFTEWECILVDDGSPDASGNICDEYKAKDTRFLVIHKENGGVSVARQTGLDAARGDYVIHADPDDWVEPTMLADLYTKAIEEDADMVICDFYVNSGENQTYRKQHPSSLDHFVVMNELFQHLHGSCCNKLVRSSCFEKYAVSFTPWMSFCEDLCINAQLLQFEIKVAYVPHAYYHYVIDANNNSLVKKISRDTLTYDLRVYDYLDNLTKPFSAHYYFEKQFSRTCTVRAFRSGILSDKEFKTTYERFANILWNWRSFSPNNMLLYFSCIGYYKICYLINKHTFLGKL